MARTASPMGIRAFFSASDARIDRWRTLNRIARRTSPCPLGWCSARDNGSPEQEAR